MNDFGEHGKVLLFAERAEVPIARLPGGDVDMDSPKLGVGT